MKEFNKSEMPLCFIPEEIMEQKQLINFLSRLNYERLGIESFKVVFKDINITEMTTDIYTKEFSYN